MQTPIADEKIRLLYDFVPGITALSLIGSITLASLALQTGQAHYLSVGIWFALSAIYFSFRYRTFRNYRILVPGGVLPPQVLAQRHAFITGCVLGAASFLFLPVLPMACQAAFAFALLWSSLAGLLFAQDARSVSTQFVATWLPTGYALHVYGEPLTVSAAILCMLVCAHFATRFCYARLNRIINAKLERDESQREEDEENALLRFFVRKAQHDLAQSFFVIQNHISGIRKIVAPHHPELSHRFEGLKHALDEMREIITTRFDHKKYSMAYLPPTRDENIHNIDA